MAKASAKKKKNPKKMSQEELDSQIAEQGFPIQRAMVNPSELVMPPKYLAEEWLKMFLAIVLFLLFLLFFGGIAWYLISTMGSSGSEAGDTASAAVNWIAAEAEVLTQMV